MSRGVSIEPWATGAANPFGDAGQAAKAGLACIVVQEAFDSRGIARPEIAETTRACEAYGAEVIRLSVGPELFYVFLRVLKDTGYFNASLYTPYSILGIETLGDELARQTKAETRRFPDVVIATHAGGGNVTVPAELIALSTVPPAAPPAPKLRLDVPYAVALREVFAGYRFRAQQNTRYIESDTLEATVTHVLDTLISCLTSADIQSTITPDEGLNIPWHYNSVAGVNATRQTLMGLDGLHEIVALRTEGPLRSEVRELTERAALFLEEILECGGYYAAVAGGQFVDSEYYPRRAGDGIARDPDGGDGAGTVIRREPDYGTPVCSHFGDSVYSGGTTAPCSRYAARCATRRRSGTWTRWIPTTTWNGGSPLRWPSRRPASCDRRSRSMATGSCVSRCSSPLLRASPSSRRSRWPAGRVSRTRR